MKFTEILLTTLSVLVLVMVLVQASPTSDLDSYSAEVYRERLAPWLLSFIDDYRRERRTQMDAGFLSRHSALKNFLTAYDASRDAADPNGPGRRK